jgi:glycosyltransferase involved in cell wall biosynthesis
MRIAIIGTRGIPNRYGGFEQFAEYAAPLLVDHGHEVYVYNSSSHPFKATEWKGVRLIRKPDPENKLGTFGQFIYDLNCILDARKRNFDVILQLGYTSSSIWSFLFPDKARIITNMDGFEWKRKKYSRLVQAFLHQAEKWAVKQSDVLIADSFVMRSYLRNKYNIWARYIPYGALSFNSADETVPSKYGLEEYQYNMLIARIEPENNIEMIIEGHLRSENNNPLFIVGNWQNHYGKQLNKKYENKKIIFYGSLFDINELNQLRYFSCLYFHGHSVGGTNPSLLEAMASHALIAAHDNSFNHEILGADAFYFKDSASISLLLDQHLEKRQFRDKIQSNLAKIEFNFSWTRIVDQLESCLVDDNQEEIGRPSLDHESYERVIR